jgi:hypothetical protein
MKASLVRGLEKEPWPEPRRQEDREHIDRAAVRIAHPHDEEGRFEIPPSSLSRCDLTANSSEIEAMQIRFGYELVYDCPQPTPMLVRLNIYYTRVSDMVGRITLLYYEPIDPDPRLSRDDALTAEPISSSPRTKAPTWSPPCAVRGARRSLVFGRRGSPF